MTDRLSAAAYGGPGWSPRTASLAQEIGTIWRQCGQAHEWSPLKSVLLHRPGPELADPADVNGAQMLAPVDADLAQEQHDALAQAYLDSGVAVHYVDPDSRPPPNLMFVADLFFMTPEGAILGRPASTVRAGEERLIAHRLAALGIPILRSVRGKGTFEGADAAWIEPSTVLLATGLRTNSEGARQVTAILQEMRVEVIGVGLPHAAMHLMGYLRLADSDLAVAWPGRVPFAAIEALQERGFRVIFAPDEQEAEEGMALNLVTLGPRRVLMAAGNPITEALFRDVGISCQTVPVHELAKAAGSIGCLTGIIEREMQE
jgi:arginine deiminase